MPTTTPHGTFDPDLCGGVVRVCLRHHLQAAARAWRRGRPGVLEWWRTMAEVKYDAVVSFRDPKPFAADEVRMAGLSLAARQV